MQTASLSCSTPEGVCLGHASTLFLHALLRTYVPPSTVSGTLVSRGHGAQVMRAWYCVLYSPYIFPLVPHPKCGLLSALKLLRMVLSGAKHFQVSRGSCRVSSGFLKRREKTISPTRKQCLLPMCLTARIQQPGLFSVLKNFGFI